MLKKHLDLRIFVYLIFFAIIVILGMWQPASVSISQWSNILLWSGLIGIVAIGQTIVILTGGIDISVGSLVLLSACLACQIMGGNDSNIILAISICLGIGLLIGFLNGIGITKGKIPPMVMTIAMSISLNGLTLFIYGGGGRGYVAPKVQNIIDSLIFNRIPTISLFWLVLAIIFYIFLNYSVFGRKVYAIGSNSKAAYFSGINVNRTIMWVYILCGILSAISGIMFAGYIHSANLAWEDNYTLPSIAAVVVGGTALKGGIGGIEGTIIGVLIIRFLTNFFFVVRFPEFSKNIMLGLIIIFTLTIYGTQKESE